MSKFSLVLSNLVYIACDAFRVAKKSLKGVLQNNTSMREIGADLARSWEGRNFHWWCKIALNLFCFLTGFSLHSHFLRLFYTLPTHFLWEARSRFFSSNGQKKRGYAYNFIHRFNFTWQSCVREKKRADITIFAL